MTRDAGNAGSSSPPPGNAPPRTEPVSLRAVLRSAISQTTTTARAVFVVACFAIAGLLYGGPNASEIRQSANWNFWLQIATGNYSPDQKGIENDEWVTGTVVAFIVNLGSFVLVFGAILQLIVIERKKLMNTREAYSDRDFNLQTALFMYIANKFDHGLKNEANNDGRQKVWDDLDQIFNEANRNMPADIVKAYGEEGKKFVESNRRDLPAPQPE
ncbi:MULTISPECIES: hypothetical protein [Methylorubrum]|uniref:hypothetical protein n=1 Tax=Methylorubrum TaxID=2282523 RepID=UPI00209F2D4C|nr:MULTISPECIES: hypothetical protein [Methylorubrum]MCP1551696.1 hypothetical protein [Methylorubrum zatmanii]MCP1556625.1 hypothetical protein [Methylorubrum extorquens]MCP1581744.1 hypothetical protein [Methylorubrum extorquens]